MFSKTIFKQTLRSNWKLWVVFTAIMAAMSALVIAVYDPKMIQGMMDMVKDMPGIADMMGDRMDGMTSLLGMLGQSFYGMQGVILALIFVIMTANTLVASQVDRGSMAYLLSTPIKRTKVVRTQAMYLITSVFAMFLVITIVGLSTVQLAHHGLWGPDYSKDVKAASDVLNLDRDAVADDLTLILNNEAAVKAGAEARGIQEDVYTVYLNQKLQTKAYEAAAEVLGIDADAVTKDLSLIKNNERALTAAAKVLGLEPAVYGATLEQTIAQSSLSGNAAQEMQAKFMAGITAAAEVLNVGAGDLATSMGKIKDNPKALTAASEAAALVPAQMFPEGTPAGVIAEQNEAAFLAVINGQLANDEISLDKGVDFSVKDYLLLNLGAFLLMFAIAGISFLFSCVFNLSKNSLMLGAGIPVAFFIFQIMSQVGSSLENFKYLSLNTLFDPGTITGNGTFWPQFAILAVLGVVLYTLGITVFKKKDLPL
ncbi:MAG: ABC transporter permease subunit [Oscillospiraceae bacterium]|jgi:ABC-2 type transport system permease protein|nr:ABC transporter permease subunit [Oscillospiraceae bacterium]